MIWPWTGPETFRVTLLTEELGEVARAVQDEPDNIDAELVQVASLAISWLVARGLDKAFDAN